MSIDYERASVLFHVVRAVADHGGMYNPIAQLANLELADMAAEAGEAIAEHNAKLAEEAQAAQAERDAERLANRPALEDVEDEPEPDEDDEPEVAPRPASPTNVTANIPRRT